MNEEVKLSGGTKVGGTEKREGKDIFSIYNIDLYKNLLIQHSTMFHEYIQ